ncbi:hypothetical protein Hokovirus_4_4 [Hokovirus HKV1]|uniref:Uncharacterized protein n=1 Tax=Hokovirus HKV1 TaxID=1977638 RepID=A0A1V0SH29_9VIRU|nr:hypothetical protein Hokovirus_4_4 [Hokovirus HKV1]
MDFDIKKIIKYTSCKYNYETENLTFYMLEMFIKNRNYLKHFINSLYFLKQENDNYICKGSNFITLITYQKNRYLQNNMKQLPNTKSYFCKLNYDIIKRIIDKTLIYDLYDNFYLSLMFDENYYEKKYYNFLYYEDDEIIIFPLLTLFYINKYILKKLINHYNTKNTNEEILSYVNNITFQVIVKPDNYQELKNLYFANDLETLINKLLNQPYVTIYDKRNYNLFDKYKNIKKKVINFYKTKFNIDNNVYMYIQNFYPHNCWIHINCIYKNPHVKQFIRLTEYHGLVDYKLYLKYLKHKIDFDNIYFSSFKENFIEEYNLTIENINNHVNNDNNFDCYKSSYKTTEETFDYDLTKRWLKKYDTKNNINNAIIKNNKLVNFEIIKIYEYKFSNKNKLCSLSLHIKINNKLYMMNIIPNTGEYLYKKFKSNEIIDFFQKDLIVKEQLKNNSSETNFIYCLKHNLKYNIEIIPNPCFITLNNDVSSLKSCNYNNFEKINKHIFDMPILLTLKTNEKLRNIQNQYIENNFIIPLSLILCNIILIYLLHYKNEIETLIIKLNNFIDNLKQKTIINHDDNYLNLLLDNINEYFYLLGYPFIGIPSYERLKNKKNFKFLIYYMHIKNINTSELNYILESLSNNLEKTDSSRNLCVSKDIYLNLFKTDLNNYVFNVSKLIINNTFTNTKYLLDKFINIFKKKHTQYLYTYFHYPNGLAFETLHIHVLDREFLNNMEIDYYIKKFNESQLINKDLYFINYNYDWLNTFWIFERHYRFYIMKEDIDYIKNNNLDYKEMIINILNKKIKYGDEFINDFYLINEKIFINLVNNIKTLNY